MTTTHDVTEQVHPMLDIELTARITVIDANGTEVTDQRLPEVVDIIRQRSQRTGQSIVTLATHHREDSFYEPTVWQLSGHKFAESNASPKNAHYSLTYDKWQVLSTDGQLGPILSGHPDSICQQLSDRTGHIVTMTSELPGVYARTYHPTRAEKVNDDPGQGTTEHDHDQPATAAHEMTEFTDQLLETQLPDNTDHEENPNQVTKNTQASPADSAPRQPGPEAAPASRREARLQRESFLTPTSTEAPASKGVRGLLSSVGIRMNPSAKERAEREDVRAISQHWPGPRTIAVANGKGGAGKTPTTILLSAVFGRFGGGTVLAWDNNQTRGTMPWRTEQGPHDSTVLDLLPEADSLLAVGAQSADLAHYLHHQPADRYEVLRSKPSSLADQQRFGADVLDKIHNVASKFFRLIIIDSGNDETDPLWQAMIAQTDQLVVPTSTADDKTEGAALLLEDLAESSPHGEHLADNAVVVVSQAEQLTKSTYRHRVAQRFEPIAREVVEVPFDPAMVSGHLAWDALQPATQRAWIAAGAAVARGL